MARGVGGIADQLVRFVVQCGKIDRRMAEMGQDAKNSH